ncbi:MAG: KOW motif-containing protein [Candidatus Shikimatogenerans sp. AspAUS03]|uniref:KOW motif-containing protein n=1 Tax=Candidatus Shikimatogenerans sp. AspAUS03 TaxID=3158563 RepID=A0AAU7QSJ3_9FLAO
MKSNFKIGNYVFILSGKYKNHIGKILINFKKKNKVLIQYINVLIKNYKYNYLIKGIQIKKEFVIHKSNIYLIKNINV